MRLLPRVLSPAGTVLRGTELAGWLTEAALGKGGAAREALARELSERYGLPHVFLVSSARAGLTVLLRALAERTPGRSEVAIPGYTCYSVAASAVRAGLRVRPLDVDASTLDIAPAALAAADLRRSLALVGTSLYGLPSALPAFEAAARAGGAALVDDAAQCLEGRIGGRWVGTFGDAGLLSFDKGKNLTSMQGGAIVTRDADLAARLARAIAALPAPARAETAMLGAKLVAYWVLLRPWLYWIPARLARLGETPFELDSPMTRLPAALAPIVRRQLARIEGITATREGNARRLREAIAGVPGITVPDRAGARCVHPRLALVFDEPGRRDAARAALVREGIGATGSYPRPIIDVPEVRAHLADGTTDTPGARRVAGGILTLPTHGYVARGDIARIARVIRGA